MIRSSFFRALHRIPVSLFSQKKNSKLLINSDEYLKDTRFDSSVKDEWARKQAEYQQEQASKSETRRNINERLRETAQDFQEAESILRSFKDRIKVEEGSNLQSAADEQTSDFLKLTKMHFEGQSDPETVSRSKRFKDRLRLRQDWSPLAHLTPKISDNYGKYSHYERSFPVLKDRFPTGEDSELSQGNFMRRIDERDMQKLKSLRVQKPTDLKRALDYEGRWQANKKKLVEKERQEMFSRSTYQPPVSSEFFNRVQWKRLVHKERMPADPEIVSKRDVTEKELPEGLLKKLSQRENLLEAEERYFEGKAGSDEAEPREDEEFNDFGEESPVASKQARPAKKGKGGFGTHTQLEYNRLIQQLHWSRDSVDEERGSDVPKREKDDWGPLSQHKSTPFQRKIKGRVSPWAKEEILRLFLEGWTVRDISLRYGILPERVKAIVWCRKTFYDEVFPHLDLTTVKLGLEREMHYGENFPWVDFGLDLEQMIRKERGVPILDFKTQNKPIDTKAAEDVERRMAALLENKQKKKQDRVTEGFIGRGNKAYFLKSWIVYKGHGSERVNRAFKRVVHFSQRRERLCNRILSRIMEGPRQASLGFGIK